MRNEGHAELDHAELLTRLSNLFLEIRFAKEQQWRILYYSLLFFSAIIALALNYGPIDAQLKKFVYTVAGLAWGTAIYYQISIFFRLRRYRRAAWTINRLIGSGIDEMIAQKSGARYRSSPFWLNFETIFAYVFSFVVLITLGVAAVVLILWFDFVPPNGQ